MKHDVYGHWWGWRPEMGLAVVESFHVTMRPKRFYRRWSFPEWMINYTFDSGERYRLVSATHPWHERAAHTLHLHPPGSLHWQNVPKGVLHRSVYVKFLGGEAAGLSALVDPQTRCGRFIDPDNIAGALLEEIARIGREDGHCGFARAQSVLWMLIARLMESVPAKGGMRRIGNRASAPPPSRLVRGVDAYLEKNVAKPLTLAALARALRISVSLLSHRYREETGFTAKESLMRLRMDRVKKMLISGTPLKAAAPAAGFRDPFYLSRAFKREEGISPREYLQQIRNFKRRTPRAEP